MIGDVVGRPGRQIITGLLSGLKTKFSLDFVVANIENAAAGFGITPDCGREILAAGVDVMTSGNHIYDKKEGIGYIESEPRLIRRQTTRRIPLVAAYGCSKFQRE